MRSYTFSYDPAKRIKSATFAGVVGENYSMPSVSYDDNGNILNLQRKGKVDQAFGDMDNLTYTYNGNRLLKVEDAVAGNYEVDFVNRNNGTDDYDYHPDGKLKKDLNEGITNIVYNTYVGQPKELQLTGGRWIKHTYNGGNELIKTEYSTGEVWHYLGEVVFKNNTPYQMNLPEGRALYSSNTWKREFSYSDHLGNTRVSFRASGDTLQKVGETAFDPWGVVLRGAGFVNGTSNRFEFQDHESEKTFGLNRVGFGYRTYNPTIGKFDRLDPLADLFETLTPYHYVTNNPVSIIDLFGLDTVKVDQLPENWNKFDPNKDVVLTNQVTVKGHYNRNFSTDGFVFRDPGNRDKGPLDVERSNNYNRKTPFTKEEMWQRSGAIETDHTLEAIFIPLPKIVGLLKGLRFWKPAVKILKPLGLGSTGRTTAASLTEQLAMKEITSNPAMGSILKLKKGMTDIRWPSANGWQKMAWHNGGVEIHYVGQWQNGILKAVDDFKFIDGK